MNTNSVALEYNAATTRFSVDLPFPDRRTAGRALSRLLEDNLDRQNTVVITLPRGGVPVAKEVATEHGLPLDFTTVCKIGVPEHEYLTMGAVATEGVLVWNESIVQRIKNHGPEINNAVQNARVRVQEDEIKFRQDRSPLQLKNRIVIITDDGMETGASMRAAIEAVRIQSPAKIITAVPVAHPETADLLRNLVDEVIVLATPEPFYGVAEWYFDYKQPTDTEICELLYGA